MAKTFRDNVIISTKRRLEEHLRELPAYCRAFFRSKENKLEPRTLCGYSEDLLIFFRYLNRNDEWEKIRDIPVIIIESLATRDIEEYLKYIETYTHNGIEYHNGENGKQRKLASLRMLCRYLCKNELLENDPTSLVEMPKRHKKNIVVLSPSNKKKLLNMVRSGGIPKHYQQRAKLEKNRLRDYAIIMVFLGTGVRISELAGLNLSDIDFSEDRLNIIRKGGNEDFVYFGEDVEKALKDYLYGNSKGCRDSFEPDPDEAAVFVSQQHTRLTVRSIQKMVKIYADMAFGKGNKYTPHSMRRTYGTALYEDKHDLELVSVVLGHASIETAKKHYVRFPEEQRKSAAIPVE